ncbi:hypothetical protein [Streptomyces formicae]|uniref:Secreted protein n=1 Tax=Streptomyces formicae TaxID=1616117 RepID=A0ABY3WLL2_9ACTN|nr:hypothetical protein [Streptomyces formicae]UNM11667.1 hypothetical protein J4032_09055 [Streptomyces formicae]
MRRLIWRLTVAAMATVGVVVLGGGTTHAESAPVAEAVAEAPAYGSFRLIKERAGTSPSVPEIVLPEGYSLVQGANHQVASKLEYYSFITGPKSTSVPVTVRWPGERIGSVVSHKTRPALTRDETAGTVTFSMPVTSPSASSAKNTLEVFSYLHRVPGTYFRLEHNDEERAAGYYADNPWVGKESRAAHNQLFAAEAVLIDSGLAAEAKARGHHWTLMGFETNNRLHPDNPPHWHLAYYPGAPFSANGNLPHLWLDPKGRNIKNSMDVAGLGHINYAPGEVAPVRLMDGSNVATLTMRTKDGGLDIDPGQGRPVYSIIGGLARDNLSNSVRVLKDGRPWLWLSTYDNVKTGELYVHKADLSALRWTTLRYNYDAQIGTLKNLETLADWSAADLKAQGRSLPELMAAPPAPPAAS